MRDKSLIDLADPQVNRMTREYVRTRDGLHWFECRKLKDQRSLSQNAYMWGIVLPAVAHGISEVWGEDINTDEAHEFLKRKFLSKPIINRRTGELKGYTEPSTASLDKEEFAKYLDNIIKFAAENLGVEVPPAKRSREEITA